MTSMMKKLKKASYKVNMEAFIENHGHYFREMTEYTENASDKETAAKELAVDFTDKVYDAYVSPKKGKIDSAIQTDLNFFMIYYVFPAILLTEHDDAKLIAELSADLGEAMVGINEQEIALLMAERGK